MPQRARRVQNFVAAPESSKKKPEEIVEIDDEVDEPSIVIPIKKNSEDADIASQTKKSNGLSNNKRNKINSNRKY